MSDKLFSGVLAAAQQAKLLRGERLTRMLESESGEEALKIAFEGGFGGGTATTLEQAVLFERNALADFIRVNCPTEKLKQYLLCRYDFLNAETLVKAKYVHFDCEGALSECGTVPSKLMKEYVDNSDYGALPKELADALKNADVAYGENKADGYEINNLFVKAYYAYIKRLARFGCFSFDVKQRIDSVNLMTAVRVDGDVEALKNSFIEGGTIPFERVKAVAVQDAEKTEKDFLFDKSREFVDALLTDVRARRPLIAAENAADSNAVRRLSDKRLDLKPIEEFYLYCLYKQMQITNVNVIVVGLDGGVDRSEIKARLRTSYEI